jgi:putative oxidoreductase
MAGNILRRAHAANGELPHTLYPGAAERAYVFLRLLAGFMFAFHGVQKLFGFLSDFQPAVGTQMWFAGIIELVCGLAIALGLFTPVAAFLASGEMAVAYFQAHWKFQVNNQFYPTINKGELAALYCALFLFIAFKGSGRYSLDSLRTRRVP